MNATHNEFVDYVVELMSAWMPVAVRKMFGGYGLYREGLMFALISDDQLYFKADSVNALQFEGEGCCQFSYASRGRTTRMSYWSAPAESLESPAAMREWCQSAYAAALRSQVAKLRKGATGKGK